MFAVILEYKKPMEDVERHTVAHRAFLDEYYAKGILVMSGRQTSAKGGVIIANAASREQVEQLFAQDPFQLEGVAEYQFYEFTPNKYQPALKTIVETPVSL
jgi:uncharacterized protein YciI